MRSAPTRRISRAAWLTPAEAAKAYLKKNPQVLDPWLAGVKTFDGKDGQPAVKAYLGL